MAKIEHHITMEIPLVKCVFSPKLNIVIDKIHLEMEENELQARTRTRAYTRMHTQRNIYTYIHIYIHLCRPIDIYRTTHLCIFIHAHINIHIYMS